MGMPLGVGLVPRWQHRLEEVFEIPARCGHACTAADSFGVRVDDERGAAESIAEDAVRRLLADALHAQETPPELVRRHSPHPSGPAVGRDHVGGQVLQPPRLHPEETRAPDQVLHLFLRRIVDGRNAAYPRLSKAGECIFHILPAGLLGEYRADHHVVGTARPPQEGAVLPGKVPYDR